MEITWKDGNEDEMFQLDVQNSHTRHYNQLQRQLVPTNLIFQFNSTRKWVKENNY